MGRGSGAGAGAGMEGFEPTWTSARARSPSGDATPQTSGESQLPSRSDVPQSTPPHTRRSRAQGAGRQPSTHCSNQQQRRPCGRGSPRRPPEHQFSAPALTRPRPALHSRHPAPALASPGERWPRSCSTSAATRPGGCDVM